MILLDPRVGSIELLEYFKSYPDIEVRVKALEFGDACWIGNGADGPVRVGVERKVLTDLISSMRSNRLSGFQLPGLLRSYQWVYLLIEGVYRCSSENLIEVYAGKKRRAGMRGVASSWVPLTLNNKPISYREVDHYLATLEHRCGVTVAWTANKQQTVAWIVSRYLWWDKSWEKHDSHQAIYAPYEHIQPGRRGMGAASFKPVGPVEIVAAQLPGVSKKAYEFRKRFKSVVEMVGADVKALQDVDGIGKTGAQTIYDWFRRQHE